MNLRTALLLLAAALVIGGIGLRYYDLEQFKKETAQAERFLPEFDLNSVAEITVKTNNSTATLKKTETGWTVAERESYPADFAAVGETVQRLWDFKPAQDVIAGPSQFARLEIVEPDGKAEGAGTLIDLKDKDGKRLAAVVVGKQSFGQPEPDSPFPPAPNGRFIVAAGSEGPVGIAAEGFDLVRDKPEMWLDRDFVKLGDIKSIALDSPDKKWRVFRDAPATPWKLDGATPNESADSTKIDPIASMMASPSFNDIAPKSTADTAFSAPSTLTLENFDGFTATYTIGARAGESYPAKVAVAASLPTQRTPAADENPEDKDRLEKEFQDKLSKLKADLEGTKKFAGRIFLLPVQPIEAALKPRDQLLAAPAPTPTPSPSPSPSPTPVPKKKKN
ncbi:MAG: DUF4340 domain-containing protein [Verrucomicrobia bacterium]|nr:DUF4340 domain-containing protein [Verrucomicrobiota bacterium]